MVSAIDFQNQNLGVWEIPLCVKEAQLTVRSAAR
jgi:hypothetical protein